VAVAAHGLERLNRGSKLEAPGQAIGQAMNKRTRTEI
jgi:hypothetical protein